MNIGLLKAISAGNVGTKPTTILKPVKTAPAKYSAAMPADTVPPTRTGKTAVTDNTRLIAQKQPIADSLNNFKGVLIKKLMTKTSRNAQANEKGKKRVQNSGAISTMSHPAKPLMLQGVLTRLVAIDKAASAKPLSRFQQQAQSRPIISPVVPEISLITNAQPESGENTGKTQISDKAKAFVAGRKLLIQENPKEPASETRPLGAEMNITSKKPITTDKPVPPKILITDIKTDPDSEHSVVINKLSVSDNPKTQPSNTPFVAPGDQSSRPSRKVLIGTESPTQAVEETTPNKADTNQKDHRGKTEIFDLPEKNRVHVGNLSVKSSTQKTNPQLTQVSASQAENHNNLLGNQHANLDMELGEHMLAGNNGQPGITKQSSASPATAFVNIAGNADSDAGVGEQIQESINNSFRTGSRQILIRLNPPDLGKVAIKFTEQNDEITGLLQVDKPQTRYQLQQALPEIIQNLQNSGITIKRLEVVLTGQQEQQTLKDQSSTPGQDTFSQQQNAPNPKSQGNNTNNTTYNEPVRDIDRPAEVNEAQFHLADSSINMLI